MTDQVLPALFIGLCAGLHTSTWGMYKDAPYEGFTWPKYFRSTVVSGIVAVVVALVSGLDPTRAPDMVVLFAFTYVVERALVEYYKTFLREQDQSKYFIPMQFSIGGKVVRSRAARLTAAAVYLAGVSLTVYGVHYLQASGFRPTGWVVVLAVGSIGGWISAFGGAWKDAPKEGFETLKFFRSPVFALIWAFMLANLTDNYLFVCFGALGLTVATIETYKTFFFPSKPRGKFAGMQIRYPEWLHRRRYFVPLYVAIWAALLATIVVAFLSPHRGLV